MGIENDFTPEEYTQVCEESDLILEFNEVYCTLPVDLDPEGTIIALK